MKQRIQQLLERVLSEMGIPPDVVPQVSVPENSLHGDYSTNVAMQIFSDKKQGKGDKGKNPREIAEEFKNAIIKDQTISDAGIIDRIEVAGPGFLNIYLSEASLISQVSQALKIGDAYGYVTKQSLLKDRSASVKQKIDSKTSSKNGVKTTSDALPAETLKTAQKPVKNPRKTAAVGNSSRQNNTELISIESKLIPEGTKKKIMVEFAHPNTHKAFHIGHLRNITTGESIVRLLESQGHTVIRANYQGDVGMHIAKALYALLELSPYKDQVKEVKGIHERVEFLGHAYAAGSQAFEKDKAAQERIKDYNYFVYASAERFAAERGLPKPSTDYLSFVKGDTSVVDKVFMLWKETRQWSLDYFETVYKRVYTHYDRLFFESECLSGVDLAKNAVKRGVLKESEGAIIFDGKLYGVDTRVFVNSLGLPTYEGKELGLVTIQTSEYPDLDMLMHVLGPEQKSFTQVTFKVEELLDIIKPGVQFHLAYGWVRLKKGKMSSRLGNVVLGEWLLDEAKKSIYTILEKTASTYSQEQKDAIAEKAAIAAVKYSFLRVGVYNDIAFDLDASVSFEGDSGPYLQYTYARCKSVLRKASSVSDLSHLGHLRESEERNLARQIMQFPDVVSSSAQNFAPNAICTYLFHLAQQFNLFYAKHPIIGNNLRLTLTAVTAQVLHNGLYLLGIETLEQM